MAIREENDRSLFRVPTDLQVGKEKPLNILAIGSCLISGFIPFFESFGGASGDYVLFNNVGQLPVAPPKPVESYDIQLVQIAARSVVPDGAFETLKYDDIAGYEQLFQHAEERLEQLIDAAMKWNKEKGIATLATNFLQPQQNPNGRLLPWYDLRNYAYFISRLNMSLERIVRSYNNAYILNFDEIAATFGRKYFQDDILWSFNHGAGLGDNDHAPDQNRLHPPRPVSEHYSLRAPDFLHAMLAEIKALHRTLRGKDGVKLVIVDLDDTLWRGVVAENGEVSATTFEGWPLGLIEALNYLKKRGVLLAIVSKNDEDRIRTFWRSHLSNRLPIEDFCAIRINWQPKSDNVQEIIRDVNVLANSVVFIDDNPVERAVVEQALPGIRTLGTDLYYLRRILLWAPELQTSLISAESGRRTEMVRAQVERESSRKKLSRDEFLASLGIEIDIFEIRDQNHPRFGRAIELINKTNQFNTTGTRLTFEDTKTGFESGLVFHAFEVTDKFTNYGLVGVVLTRGGVIEQFVMSCRVIGLDVELFVLRKIADAMMASSDTIQAVYLPNDRNNLCADLYERAGFLKTSDALWTLSKRADAAAE